MLPQEQCFSLNPKVRILKLGLLCLGLIFRGAYIQKDVWVSLSGAYIWGGAYIQRGFYAGFYSIS